MRKILLILLSISFISSCFGITGDVTGDNKVDVSDLVIFADEWLTEGTLCDFDSSGRVDFKDFAALAENWQGHLISLPTKATNPVPANNATGISINTSLSWTGNGANYDIYFGTANPPPLLATHSTETIGLSTLNFTTVYYWRVDSKNADGTTTGDIWQFTTRGNLAPSANDITVSAYTLIPTEIVLQSTDDGLPLVPGKLKYYITDIPDDSGCYVQDPTSGGQAKIRESDLPYKLSTWGKQIIFATSNTGTDLIKYKTFDGLLYSPEKTITVNIAANPQDCLSFNGNGYITIAGQGLVNKRGYALYINTRATTGILISNHIAGQAGFKVVLSAGIPTLNLYSAEGLIKSVRHVRSINDGQWHNFGIIYDANGFVRIDDLKESEIDNLNFYSTEWIVVPVLDYTNTADLIIGQNYQGKMDNIRVYLMDTLWDSYYDLTGYIAQTRSEAGTLNAFFGITLSPGAVNRFLCDYNGVNNTANQIYDDVSVEHLIGSISSSDHVKYIPFDWHWSDSSFIHQMR